MRQLKPKRLCLYCGEPTKRGKRGEHIIPEAVGGALTLNDVPTKRVVCAECNNGVLSRLDAELCSRSYLSVIASREIGAHVWQVWDVAHSSSNLLLEARPAWAIDETLSALVCYPQIVFEKSGLDICGDREEFHKFGREHAVKVLVQAVRCCFRRYCSGEKRALHFERVRTGGIEGRYRLAPRVFTRHTIDEVAQDVRDQSFILRFASDKDKRFALHALSNMDDRAPLKKWSENRGSHYPSIRFFFDIGITMRALMKLGLNLIAAHCPNTPVNRESFAAAIRIIRGEAGQIPLAVMRLNGFVHAEDVQAISAPGNAHSFRLIHVNGTWHVLSSFFGGKVGSYVRVAGPNHEQWRCADIIAPLGSKDWALQKSCILPYMKAPRLEWNNAAAVVPSVKLESTVSSITVESIKKKPAGTLVSSSE